MKIHKPAKGIRHAIDAVDAPQGKRVVIPIRTHIASAIRWLSRIVASDREDLAHIFGAGDALVATNGLMLAAIRIPPDWPSDVDCLVPEIQGRLSALTTLVVGESTTPRDGSDKRIRFHEVRPEKPPAFQIAVNAKLLTLALQEFTRSKFGRVTLTFWSATAPMEIRSEDAYVLLMPMHKEWGSKDEDFLPNIVLPIQDRVAKDLP